MDMTIELTGMEVTLIIEALKENRRINRQIAERAERNDEHEKVISLYHKYADLHDDVIAKLNGQMADAEY